MDQYMDTITDEFREAVKAAVEERTDGSVIIEPVLKNNGVKLNGLSIRPMTCAEGETTVSPTFYLENIVPEYRGIEHVADLAEQIVEIIQSQKSSIKMEPEKIAGLLGDKSEVEKRIMPRLINYGWNQELLQSVPYRRFLDLAVTFDIEVSEGSLMRVRDEHKLPLSVDEMYSYALRNARLKRYSVMRIGDMIEQATQASGFNIISGLRPKDTTGAVPMVVITNSDGNNGAYGMLDEELLRSVADGFTIQEKGGAVHRGIDSMFLIPSSIHEIIATPVDWGSGARKIESEINRKRQIIDSIDL